MMLELICRLGYKALWINNKKDLLNQALDRAKANIVNCTFGTITEGKVNIGDITFATIQTLAKIDLTSLKDEFAIIICDECFPAGTPILTKEGIKNIENLRIGDKVLSYNHKLNIVEEKEILNLFKKKPNEMIKINNNLICTSNHPIFTKRGYISAKELNKNDYVLLCMWEGSKKRKYYKKSIFSLSKTRESLLFKRVRFAEAKDCNQERNKIFNRNKAKNERIFKEQMERPTIQRKKYSKNENKQPYEAAIYKREIKEDFKRNKSQAYNTGWKWQGNDSTSRKIIQFFKKNFTNSRVCSANKYKKRKWLSEPLQNRYCFSKSQNSNRSRWKFSQQFKSKRARFKKRFVLKWARVESIEIQERTSDGKFRGLCKDGYVYNIEVKDNNNYFANNILVHNCQNFSGTPTKLTQSYKVLSQLAARFKYGCTACVHRSDGLMQAGLDLIGEVVYEVPEEAIADKIIRASIQPVHTQFVPTESIGPDGVVKTFASLTTELCLNEERNDLIVEVLNEHKNRHIIVLSDRLQQLKILKQKYGSGLMIDGKMNTPKGKEQRRNAIEKMRSGEENVLYATYSLAKEGLDIPILDTLIMASPKKDKSVIIQSVGRIERKYEGKTDPIVFDIVDDASLDYTMFENMFIQRKRIYKANKNEIK